MIREDPDKSQVGMQARPTDFDPNLGTAGAQWPMWMKFTSPWGVQLRDAEHFLAQKVPNKAWTLVSNKWFSGTSVSACSGVLHAAKNLSGSWNGRAHAFDGVWKFFKSTSLLPWSSSKHYWSTDWLLLNCDLAARAMSKKMESGEGIFLSVPRDLCWLVPPLLNKHVLSQLHRQQLASRFWLLAWQFVSRTSGPLLGTLQFSYLENMPGNSIAQNHYSLWNSLSPVNRNCEEKPMKIEAAK